MHGGCAWGSVLAITWTRAVISCQINCCQWPVFFLKNLVLTSILIAVILRLLQTPPSADSIFYNIDIGDLPSPICRCSSRLRCRRFSMSDVYIGQTLLICATSGKLGSELLYTTHKKANDLARGRLGTVGLKSDGTTRQTTGHLECVANPRPVSIIKTGRVRMPL